MNETDAVPAKRLWSLYFLYLAVLFLGVTSTLLYQAWGREATHAEKVKKLEADVRTYAGKYLDLQEVGNEELDSARMNLTSMEWRAKQAEEALAACQAKNPVKK